MVGPRHTRLSRGSTARDEQVGGRSCFLHHKLLMSRYIFTSESVSEGHPDKVCDYIADSILDAHLELDPTSRVACEVLCKSGQVVLAGEITSSGIVDYERVARNAIR